MSASQAAATADTVVTLLRPPAAAVLTTLGNILSAEERQNLERMRHAGRRDEYLAGRLLCRHALSHTCPGVAPHEWRIGAGEYGKPYVQGGPPGHISLPLPLFNLTHTEGLLACVVHHPQSPAAQNDRERGAVMTAIGIDVEYIHRRSSFSSIAKRYFAATEVRFFESVPAARQRRVFFQLWTLKEALIKAKATGLHLPLGHFSFTIRENAGEENDGTLSSIQIDFLDEVEDEHPSQWAFSLEPVDPATLPNENDEKENPSSVRLRGSSAECTHLVAIAARYRVGQRPAMSLRWRTWSP